MGSLGNQEGMDGIGSRRTSLSDSQIQVEVSKGKKSTMRCSQEFPIDYLRKIQTKYKTTVFCSGRNLKINKGPWIIRTFKGARGHARATLRIIWPHGWSKDLGPARQGPTCRAVRAVQCACVLGFATIGAKDWRREISRLPNKNEESLEIKGMK